MLQGLHGGMRPAWRLRRTDKYVPPSETHVFESVERDVVSDRARTNRHRLYRGSAEKGRTQLRPVHKGEDGSFGFSKGTILFLLFC